MRSGDHDAAVVAEFSDREIQRVRGNQADVDDVRAGFARTACKRFEEAFPGRAHIAAYGDCLRAEQRDETAADLISYVFVKLCRINAANVVALENSGIQLRLHIFFVRRFGCLDLGACPVVYTR